MSWIFTTYIIFLITLKREEKLTKKTIEYVGRSSLAVSLILERETNRS